MVPTADQVAHAVVAASRHFGVDPVLVARQIHTKGGLERSRALSYAMVAIADLWGNDKMASRLFGPVSTRVSTVRWQVGRLALKWWDPKVLELVKAAIPNAPAGPPVRSAGAEAPTLPPKPKTAPVPALRKPAGLPAKFEGNHKGASVQTPMVGKRPNYGTVGRMGPPRPYSPARDLIGEKATLRDELARAVANTAKMPSQN